MSKEELEILEKCNPGVIYFANDKDSEKIAQALEHLLQEYKLIQKESKSLQKAYNDCYCGYKHYKQFDSTPNSKIIAKEKSLLKKLSEPNNDRWEKDDEKYYNEIKAQLRLCKELLEEK